MFKIINILKNSYILNGDSSYAELIRTYIVGIFNLVIGLVFNYFFQFYIFYSIAIPNRTYLTNIASFVFGVIISYFLTRMIIFKLHPKQGSIKEFTTFLFTNLINLALPLLIWFTIDIYRPSIQESEVQFLIATVAIHGSILPIKYLIYKFFVFKDSLDS